MITVPGPFTLSVVCMTIDAMPSHTRGSDAGLEQRLGRGTGQPAQDPQAPDVWPRQPRPARTPLPARSMITKTGQDPVLWRDPVTRGHGTRTALYLRVSTAERKPDLQYDGLRSYAARAGLDVVQDYCDVAGSGRREGRPQLNALMAAARNREIDCVLMWKFDRFARSTRHLLMALEEFDHLGVRFVRIPTIPAIDSDRNQPPVPNEASRGFR